MTKPELEPAVPANTSDQLKQWLQQQGVPDHLVLPLLRRHTNQQISNGLKAGFKLGLTPEAAAERVLEGRYGVKDHLRQAQSPVNWARAVQTGGELASPVKQPKISRQQLLNTLEEQQQHTLQQLPQIP